MTDEKDSRGAEREGKGTSGPRIACPSFPKSDPKTRPARRPPVSISGAKVDLHFGDAPNPFHSRAHAEDATNPKTIRVARNLNESPLVRLSALGTIDARQARAGYYVRALHERISSSNQSSSFLRERVDGSRYQDGFTDSRSAAAHKLAHLAETVGPEAFHILLKVCAEGLPLNRYAVLIRRRRADMPGRLRGALDLAAAFMGLGKPKADNDAG